MLLPTEIFSKRRKIYACEEKPELHMHMYFHILFLELYLVFGARATRYFWRHMRRVLTIMCDFTICSKCTSRLAHFANLHECFLCSILDEALHCASPTSWTSPRLYPTKTFTHEAAIANFKLKRKSLTTKTWDPRHWWKEKSHQLQSEKLPST